MSKLRLASSMLSAAAIAALLLIASASGARSIISLPCGLTIDANTKLTHDLDLSAGGSNGVCFDADNITLNLNGHSIIGEGGGDGAYGVWSNGFTGDQITNGKILHFAYDVYLESTTSAKLSSLTLVADDDNSYYGVFDYDSSGSSYQNIRTTGAHAGIYAAESSNGLVKGLSSSRDYVGFWGFENVDETVSKSSFVDDVFGIYNETDTADTFARNTAKDTDFPFYEDSSNGNTYSGNTAINGYEGFFINSDGSGPVTLLGNSASGMDDIGFYLNAAYYDVCSCQTDAGSTVSGNTATDSAGVGFYDDTSINATWSGNTAAKNGEYGFQLNEPQNDLITANTAKSNAYAGIYLADNDPSSGRNAAAFANNTAQKNGDYGLYADYPQVGTGNKAKQNVPFDCWNVTCLTGRRGPAATKPVKAGPPTHSGAPSRAADQRG